MNERGVKGDSIPAKIALKRVRSRDRTKEGFEASRIALICSRMPLSLRSLSSSFC
jgi:hypothetical protein